MSDSEPAVDFTRIRFPTDRLTVKALRRVYPSSFDRPAPALRQFAWRGKYGRSSVEDALGATVDAERQLASIAFKQTLGLPLTETEQLWPPEAEVATLADEYTRLGLAVGKHEADELVRKIAAQAVAQARQFGGRSR